MEHNRGTDYYGVCDKVNSKEKGTWKANLKWQKQVFTLVIFKAGILFPFSFQLFQEIIFLKAYKNSLGGKSF